MQRPKTFNGLLLNDRSETKFRRNGRWRTYGAGAFTTSELYNGNKIEAQGGLWDEFRNHRRNFQEVTFKYQGKSRNARCRAFTAVYDPS